MADKVRLQFDFTPEAFQELSDLQARTGASTKAETIRYAIRALQWITDELASGADVLVRHESEVRVAVFPFFSKSQTIHKRPPRHKRAGG